MIDNERALLQKRIKHQRAELKRLNQNLMAKQLLLERYFKSEKLNRIDAYRHAAQIAESCWFGSRIAKHIRRWS